MRLLKVVDSDIIESIGFTEGSPLSSGGNVVGTLGVVFKSGTGDLYEYKDVSANTFAVLASSDSIGKKFHELFKRTGYPFTKSAVPPAPPSLKK